MALLGPQTPPGCLRALEVALVRKMSLGLEAPHTSWRRLAGAYEGAGMGGPGLPELARSLVVLA